MIIKFLDNLLNKITMYRLVLYLLIGLLAFAAIFGWLGYLPYSPVSIIYSVFYITIICWLLNTTAAWVFDAPTNVESVYITALILALIISPIKTSEFQYFSFVFWASTWAMVCKYLIAIGKKHIFNPAAFAVALTAITINQSASWWVGTAIMLPFVAIAGFLIVRKIKRFDLLWGFFIVAAISVIGFSLLKGENLLFGVQRLVLNSPLVFFGTIMLTEPLTTPPTRGLQIGYGVLVGFLFAPQIHIGSVYSTPELALLTGNIFAYLVSPKQKLLLKLSEKIQLIPSVFEFTFKTDKKMKFKPGQYMEWTLDHNYPDSRGNRRYFTVASSPTEDQLMLGVKFYDPPSSYKKSLINLEHGDRIVASQLAGDFTMPKDPNQKLVFIAGGIGITPFRSMIKYLLDKGEKRSIIIFYSNRKAGDIVYNNIFDQANKELGIKTIYTITDQGSDPSWQGRRGIISGKVIAEEIPDFTERTFYISGPRSMILTFEKTLNDLGIKKNKIKTDYFPGFA